MRHSIRLLTLSALLLAASGMSAHAVVDPGVSVSGSWFTNTTATGYVFGSNSNAGYNPFVGITSYSHDNVAHTFSANAFMGEVKLFNEVVRSDNGTSRGSISGGFQDMITISDPARTGHQGVFTGSLHIHMDQVVTGQAYDNYFSVTVASSMGTAKNPGGKYAEQAYNWFGGTPISLNNDLAFSIPFSFGTAFDVGVWMSSYVEVGGYGNPGTIRHDATNTLAWNGITSIQDTTTSETVAPEDYTAMGAQGMNWAQPVPEPSSALLVSLAGAAIAGFRRLRK